MVEMPKSASNTVSPGMFTKPRKQRRQKPRFRRAKGEAGAGWLGRGGGSAKQADTQNSDIVSSEDSKHVTQLESFPLRTVGARLLSFSYVWRWPLLQCQYYVASKRGERGLLPSAFLKNTSCSIGGKPAIDRVF